MVPGELLEGGPMSDLIVRNWQRRIRVPNLQISCFAQRLRERLRLRDVGFSVALVGDRRMRGLNRQFRLVDKPTDVLSFPVGRQPAELEGGGGYLGDLVISVETANRQALAQRHPLETELQILMIHGLLHLLGYDHERDQGQMRRKELALRRELFQA